MDDLDLKKINAMLGMPSGPEHESDLDESQLEDELEAILSGRSVSSSANKSKRQSGNRSSAVSQISSNNVSGSRPSRPGRQREIEQRLQQLNIDDSLLNEDDTGMDEDELVDENDPTLLAELGKIVGGPMSHHQDISSTKASVANVGQPKQQLSQQPCLLLSDHHFRPNPGHQIQPTQAAALQSPPPVPPLPTNYVALDSVAKQTQLKSISQASPPKVKKKEEIPNSIGQLSKKDQLIDWRNTYRTVALEAKRQDDKAKAIEYMKQAKKIDSALIKLQSDPNVDLLSFDLQPPPTFSSSSVVDPLSNRSPKAAEAVGPVEFNPVEEFPQMSGEEAQKIFNAPPPPSSVLEALEQRLQKFKQTLDQAQAENNSSKVRRLGRIVKNYETAIKAYKQNKDYDYESLPIPPGFAEIEIGPPKANVIPAARPASAQPAPAKSPAPQPPKTQPKVIQPQPAAAASKPAPVQPIASKQFNRSQSTEKKVSSIAEKQIVYLAEKQRLFKEAALEAKRRGDMEQAKEYLRNAKGFDPLIEATRNGLPIDASSIPEPPQAEGDFVIVSQPSEYSNPEMDSDRDEMFRKLEMELTSQIEMCNTNKDHFLRLGDVSSATKFEKFSIEMKKDLNVLQNNWRRGDQIPKYHYEQKSFSIVVSNTELSNSQISIEVIRAIDLSCKGEPDTFVKVEFPFPKENPQCARTHTIKNTKNPEYKQSFMFEIDRKSRSLVRSLKKSLKCEIYLKGGFFRNDQLLGTVNAPLNDLETKCQIFDSFPLTSGRKIIGGQLQLRIKVREPFLAKQVEEIREKWLILG